MEVWVNLIQTFGLAVALLLAIGFGIWKMAKWTGTEIVIPIRNSLIGNADAVLKRMETNLNKVEASIERMVIVFERQSLDQSNAPVLAEIRAQGERMLNEVRRYGHVTVAIRDRGCQRRLPMEDSGDDATGKKV